eukprot:TRINITY_DN3208_c0_g1_i1.p1 TRINITY_DN3208_c0_g1~~TRINITY_DN3208_c0_g1_i1.p1  ORF type:complete len:544 (-),score=156.52 TRINITY_DN3208_c0_g1_i1:81-1712(-)
MKQRGSTTHGAAVHAASAYTGDVNSQRVFRLFSAALVLSSLLAMGFVIAGARVHTGGAAEETPERARFVREYGRRHGYGYNGTLYELRANNFPYLEGSTYLDFTGSGLYQCAQLKAFTDNLNQNLYGNSHSVSPCSQKTQSGVDGVRQLVLQFFNADPAEYSVVFTSGCTAALKMVGEYFPFATKSKYYYLLQNHNSVLGIRQYAVHKGAEFRALADYQVNEYFTAEEDAGADDIIGPAARAQEHDVKFNLFAFPAEDNFEGVRYPLSWIDAVHRHSRRSSQWLVLLDAAAYAPTARLDLSQYKPDFVSISFYKIFGFPTGLGALVLRNDVVDILKPTYWGGGQVIASLSGTDWHVLLNTVHERLEAGTTSFLDIMSVRYGLEAMSAVGGMDAVDQHTFALSQYLYDQMSALKHSNGRQLCVTYGRHTARNRTMQGPIVTFNLKNDKGEFLPFEEIQQRAANRNVNIRTGCMCNPGACHRSVGLAAEAVVQQVNALQHHDASVCRNFDMIDGTPFGAVRASLGYPSSFEDVLRFVVFLQTFLQ